jgi:hypothetical protein
VEALEGTVLRGELPSADRVGMVEDWSTGVPLPPADGAVDRVHGSGKAALPAADRSLAARSRGAAEERRLASARVLGSTICSAFSGRSDSFLAITGVTSRLARDSTSRKTRSSSDRGATRAGGAVRSGPDITTPVRSSRPFIACSPGRTSLGRCGLAKSLSDTTFQPRRSISATRTRPSRPRATSSRGDATAACLALAPPGSGCGITLRRGGCAVPPWPPPGWLG